MFVSLFQFCQCFGYAPDGLADVVVACGIAQAYVARCAERCTVDGGHVAFLKEVHGEVACIVYLTAAVALAEIAAHFG